MVNDDHTGIGEKFDPDLPRNRTPTTECCECGRVIEKSPRTRVVKSKRKKLFGFIPLGLETITTDKYICWEDTTKQIWGRSLNNV